MSQPSPECSKPEAFLNVFACRGLPQAVRTRPQSSGIPCARSFLYSCESLPRRHSDAKGVVLTCPLALVRGASIRMPKFLPRPRRSPNRQTPGLLHVRSVGSINIPPSIVQFVRSIVSVQLSLLHPASVLGQQLRDDHRRFSSRKRVATSSAFRTKSYGRAAC